MTCKLNYNILIKHSINWPYYHNEKKYFKPIELCGLTVLSCDNVFKSPLDRIVFIWDSAKRYCFRFILRNLAAIQIPNASYSSTSLILWIACVIVWAKAILSSLFLFFVDTEKYGLGVFPKMNNNSHYKISLIKNKLKSWCGKTEMSKFFCFVDMQV